MTNVDCLIMWWQIATTYKALQFINKWTNIKQTSVLFKICQIPDIVNLITFCNLSLTSMVNTPGIINLILHYSLQWCVIQCYYFPDSNDCNKNSYIVPIVLKFLFNIQSLTVIYENYHCQGIIEQLYKYFILHFNRVKV